MEARVEDTLFSAGTSADSSLIQLVEAIAIVCLAGVVGMLLLGEPLLALLSGLLASGFAIIAYKLRRMLVIRNEAAARDAASYVFDTISKDAIQNLVLPDKVRSIAMELPSNEPLKLLEIKAKFKSVAKSDKIDEYVSTVVAKATRAIATDAPKPPEAVK